MSGMYVDDVEKQRLLSSSGPDGDDSLLTQEEASEAITALTKKYRIVQGLDENPGLHTEKELDFETYHEEVDKVLDNTDWEEKGEDGKPPKFAMTEFNAIFTLVAGIIGAGILQMPFAFQTAGFLNGLLIALVCLFMSHLGGVYIGLAGRLTNETSLGKIAQEALGVPGLVLSLASLLGLVIAASVAYVIFMYMLIQTEFLPNYIANTPGVRHGFRAIGWETVIKDKGPWANAAVGLFKPNDMTPEAFADAWRKPRLLVLGVMFVPLFLLCSLRTEQKLERVSQASFYVFMLAAAVVVFKGIADCIGQANVPQNADDVIERLNNPCYGIWTDKVSWTFAGENMLEVVKKSLFAMSMLNTGFVCHFSCAPVFCGALQKASFGRMQKVMGSTLLISFGIYFVFALAGFNMGVPFQDMVKDKSGHLKCKQGSQELVLDVLGEDTWPSLISKGSIFGVLFLTFPLFIIAARNTVHGLIWGDKESALPLHLLETLFFVGLVFAIAIIEPSALSIMGYAGAGPGAWLVSVLPGLMCWRLNKSLPWSHKHKLMPFLLFVIGCVVTVICLYLVSAYQAEIDLGLNEIVKSDEGENAKYQFKGFPAAADMENDSILGPLTADATMDVTDLKKYLVEVEQNRSNNIATEFATFSLSENKKKVLVQKAANWMKKYDVYNSAKQPVQP